MATFQLFFQSGGAKDLSAHLYKDNIFQRSQYLVRQITTGNHYPKMTTDSIQGPDFVKIKVPSVLVQRRRLSAGK